MKYELYQNLRVLRSIWKALESKNQGGVESPPLCNVGLSFIKCSETEIKWTSLLMVECLFHLLPNKTASGWCCTQYKYNIIMQKYFNVSCLKNHHCTSFRERKYFDIPHFQKILNSIAEWSMIHCYIIKLELNHLFKRFWDYSFAITNKYRFSWFMSTSKLSLTLFEIAIGNIRQSLLKFKYSNWNRLHHKLEESLEALKTQMNHKSICSGEHDLIAD